MKRWLWALALLGATSAYAAPTCTLVGVGSSGLSQGTVTPTVHASTAAGDLLLYFLAAVTTSETSDTDPSGYTLLLQGDSTNYEVWGKIATATETGPSASMSGSSRTGAFIVTLRSSTGWPAIGSVVAHSASAVGTSQTQLRYAALTISTANTCAIQFAYKGLTTGNTNVASSLAVTGGFSAASPSAIAQAVTSAIVVGAQFQSQTTATNLSTNTVAITSNTDSTNSKGISLSLAMNAESTLTLTSVSTDDALTYAEANVVAAGTGFKASQTTGFMQLRDGSITSSFTIDSWSDTSIQGDTVQGNVRFGSRVVRVQNSDSDNVDRAVTLNVPSGEWYSDISGIVALDFNTAGTATGRVRGQPNRYYDYPTDLQNGDQLHCKRTGGTGNLTLNANGTFEAASTITQIQCRIWHTNAWGSFQTWDLTGAPPTFSGPGP